MCGVVFADETAVFLLAQHADELLSTAHDIWHGSGVRRKRLSGRSLREQLEFARYMQKRAADPSYTFRQHLRKISGAIEE